jgi:hypothetical protein
MRSIKELLIIVRDNLHLINNDDNENIPYYRTRTYGICDILYPLQVDGIITKEEKSAIVWYLSCNLPPKIFKTSTVSSVLDIEEQPIKDRYVYKVGLSDAYGFSWIPSLIEPRREWLDEQIKMQP